MSDQPERCPHGVILPHECRDCFVATADPYQSEDYQRFMAEVAKTCEADDAPCDSCLAGGICDGPPRPDPLWDSGLDDEDFHDSQP